MFLGRRLVKVVEAGSVVEGRIAQSTDDIRAKGVVKNVGCFRLNSTESA